MIQIKKKEKTTTISISIPESLNDFLDLAVKGFNEKNGEKVSKSAFICAIIESSIANYFSEDEANTNKGGKA